MKDEGQRYVTFRLLVKLNFSSYQAITPQTNPITFTNGHDHLMKNSFMTVDKLFLDKYLCIKKGVEG